MLPFRKNIHRIILLTLVVPMVVLTAWISSLKNDENMQEELISFINGHIAKVKPVYRELNEICFKAAVSGKKEDYENIATLELQLSKIFADKTTFNQLKRIKESNTITNELLKRELDVVYNDFLRKQIDENVIKEMIDLSTLIEHKFSTYRTTIGLDTLTDNDVEEVLSTETNSEQLKRTWVASKKIGEILEEDILKIVRLRNQSARSVGFSNYHEMMLKLSDQDPEEISNLFDQLDRMTSGTFMILKQEIDTYLAGRCHIKKEMLMPWHYQNRFFQEAPAIYDVNLDGYFVGLDLAKVTADYYASIGLDIAPILKRSDLYEKPGKNQHAFCTHIDREGDVRVLCNLKQNQYWMNTILHEFGHGVYDLYLDQSLPYVLREPAHTFTTEAIAMMFGRLSTNPQWINDMIGLTQEENISEACHKSFRLEQMVFSRWSQVMYRFEKALYQNPDQDLNKLWWDLVEKYQMIKRPPGRNKPDWASKIHIATAPCYYHNYLLGELLASQLHYHITDKVIGSGDFMNQSYYKHPEVGHYLVENIFKPGNRWHWNVMIEKATGEKLTAKYYALQFVK